MSDLRYPIGKFTFPKQVSIPERDGYLEDLAKHPRNVRGAVSGLSDKQLDTPYRPGGWTVRQVVHHLPDSHMNSYIRFKLAMTEEQPTIRPYAEDRWAELSEARSAPLDVSLDLLDSLHTRWVLFLRSFSEGDFARTMRHPELGAFRLDQSLALYAWHGKHHVAHITALREREDWN